MSDIIQEERKQYNSDDEPLVKSETISAPKTSSDKTDQNLVEFKASFVWSLAVMGSIGGFLFGYDTGIIAGAQLYFKDTWPDITIVQRELVVSMALLGAFVGSLVAGPISDTIGRKPVILASDFLFIVGSLVMANAESIAVLITGRIIIGLAIGVASMIVPVYLSEISPVRIRGRIVAIYILCVTAGQALSSVLCLILGRNWRLMLGLATIPAAIQGFWMIFMPETQRWLAKKGKYTLVQEVLSKVYAQKEAAQQYSQLKREMHQIKKYINMSKCDHYRQLFTIYKNCLIIGCSLQFFKQFIGINTVMYYGPQIIIDSGTHVDGYQDREKLAVLLNIPLAFTNAFGSLIGIFVIDKYGRRNIMLRSLPGIFGSLIAISGCMWTIIYNDDLVSKQYARIALFVFLITYLLFFSIGFSTAVWAVNSEIFPIHLIGTAVSISTATNWLSNFAVASVFLTSMESDAGKVYTFDILAYFALFALLFIYFNVPETGGKNISENTKEIIGQA